MTPIEFATVFAAGAACGVVTLIVYGALFAAEDADQWLERHQPSDPCADDHQPPAWTLTHTIKKL